MPPVRLPWNLLAPAPSALGALSTDDDKIMPGARGHYPDCLAPPISRALLVTGRSAGSSTLAPTASCIGGGENQVRRGPPDLGYPSICGILQVYPVPGFNYAGFPGHNTLYCTKLLTLSPEYTSTQKGTTTFKQMCSRLKLPATW